MSEIKVNCIEIELPNGYKLVAEQNTPPYSREIFIGIVDPNGVWHQDLAVVRSSYHYEEGDKVIWDDKKFDVLVYGSEGNEDFTEDFTVGLYEGIE